MRGALQSSPTPRVLSLAAGDCFSSSAGGTTPGGLEDKLPGPLHRSPSPGRVACGRIARRRMTQPGARSPCAVLLLLGALGAIVMLFAALPLNMYETAAMPSYTPGHTSGFVASVAAFMVVLMAEAAGGLAIVTFVLALCVTQRPHRGRIFGRRAAPYCSGERTAIVLLWMLWGGGRYCVSVGAAPMTDVEFTAASWGEYTCVSCCLAN